MLLKSPIQMAHNKLYNINCQQAVYRPVYMQPVGCSVVMLHSAAVRTVCCCMVCIQINTRTYRSGAIKLWMFLTAQSTGSFLVRYSTGSFLVRYTTGSFLVRYATGSFLVRYTTGRLLFRFTRGSFLVRYTTGSFLVRYTTGSFLIKIYYREFLS